MNYLETLLTQAQYEVKKLREQNEPTEFAKGFYEGYQACERFYTMPNPILPTGCEMPWDIVEPWDTEDAKIRQHAYACGFQDGFNAIKVGGCQEVNCEECKGSEMPEAWITEYRTKGTEKDWQRSGDEGLKGIFNSEKAAQAAVDADTPDCTTSVRRVRRVD